MQRGNNRDAVFQSTDDYRLYLDRYFGFATRYRVRTLAYCLMPNHVHFIVVPEDGRSLGRLFGRLHADFARFANVKQERSGHFWRERFFSCPMDESHTLQAIAYVEQNPIRAQLAGRAWDYPWSSAAQHLDPPGRESDIDRSLWSKSFTPARWSEILSTNNTPKSWQNRFREATGRGLPLGEDGYVSRLEGWADRPLRHRGPGRARKVELTPCESV